MNERWYWFDRINKEGRREYCFCFYDEAISFCWKYKGEIYMDADGYLVIL